MTSKLSATEIGLIYQNTGTLLGEDINDIIEKVNTGAGASLSLSELINISSDLSPGVYVETGEYVKGTGYGGNTYQLMDAGDSDSRPVEDGGSVLYVDGGSGGLYLKGLFPRGVSVTQFGALGDYDESLDSGTDDSIAIIAAMSYADSITETGRRKYKVTQEIAITKKINVNLSGGTYFFQRDITKPLFNLDGMDGSTFTGGNYSHNMDIGDYSQSNGKLFFGSVDVDELTFDNVNIYRTAQQGITLNSGGKNFMAIACSFENTARDGIFLVDPDSPKVSFCKFKNTGDDSLVAARQAKNVIFTNNSIEGAGSYNLGGSGIRCNGSGVIANNTIMDSDIFGIVAAINDDDATAKPFDLKVTSNTIKGITGSGVTAGIGIKTCSNVSFTDNDIDMPSNEAHAYRIYDDASSTITITGGSVRNAKSLLYIRNGAASNISISNVENEGCTDNVLVDSTGDIERITLNGVKNYGVSSYIRFSFSATTELTFLDTINNRTKDETGAMFQYASQTITRHNSTNDQYSLTESDNSNSSNVASITEISKITI